MGGSPILSHLFTASTTGLPLRMSIPAMSRSCGVTPPVRSVTMMMQSAESMAIWACSRMWASRPSSMRGSMPPVSTSRNLRPLHSQSQKMRSRVTPGVSSTMARRWPVSLLKIVDLPTLGRPTMATMGFAMVVCLLYTVFSGGSSVYAVPPAAMPGSSRRRRQAGTQPGSPAPRTGLSAKHRLKICPFHPAA